MGSQRAPQGSGIESRERRPLGLSGPTVLVAFALLLGPGCSSEPTPPRTGDAAAAATDARVPDAEPEPSPDPDAAPRPVPDAGPPMSCVAIRNCIVRCETDTTCAQRCVDQAAMSARTTYQRVVTCSRGVCAADDINCRCEQECQGGGACLDLVDECRGPSLGDDTFCDELCM
jgi:hypothetical protein